jgi:hypothetical protein
LQPRLSILPLASLKISSDSALVSQAITRFATARNRLKDQSNAKKLPFVSRVDQSACRFLSVRAASFADAVVGYDHRFSFGIHVSFTNATAVLGEPSRITPGPSAGPVDPFNPPYLDTQLLTVGQEVQSSSVSIHPFSTIQSTHAVLIS